MLKEMLGYFSLNSDITSVTFCLFVRIRSLISPNGICDKSEISAFAFFNNLSDLSTACKNIFPCSFSLILLVVLSKSFAPNSLSSFFILADTQEVGTLKCCAVCEKFSVLAAWLKYFNCKSSIVTHLAFLHLFYYSFKHISSIYYFIIYRNVKRLYNNDIVIESRG